MVRKKSNPVKKADLTFRKGITRTEAGITADKGIARMTFKCVMDDGKTQIGEVATKFRPDLRIDFQSVDGKFNLSLRNGLINVSNAKEGDEIEVDQSWCIGRAAGHLGDDATWLIRDGTLTIDGEGKMPDYNEAKEAPWYIYRSNIKSLEIKGGIASVGKRCFNRYKNLVEANLGNATVVANRAFAGCISLQKISIDAVQAINASAFSDCVAIDSIRFGSKLKKIDKSAFAGCTSLKNITFNAGTAPAVDASAFEGCSDIKVVSAFTDIEALDSAEFDVRKIVQVYVEEVPGAGQHSYQYAERGALAVKAADAAGNIYGLTDEYSVEPPFIEAESSATLRISYAGITSLIKTELSPRMSGNDVVEWSFDENSGTLNIGGTNAMPDYDAIERAPWSMLDDDILEIRISNGVPNIGKKAFDGCRKLKTLHAEDATVVGDYAFRNCTSLDCLHLTSVKSIGSYAFQGCTSLVSAYLGPGIAKIRKHAFENCKELSVLRMDCDATPAIEEAALNGVAGGFIIVSKLDEGWADTATDVAVVYKKG